MGKKDITFTCIWCGEVFKTRAELRAHYRTVHSLCFSAYGLNRLRG